MSKRKAAQMTAVQWEDKPNKVAVKEIPKPTIQDPLDAIIRVTTAAICGSDLHDFRGRWPTAKPPLTLGHEVVGIIESVGSGVTTLKKGDRVVVYDCISCGFCDNCVKGQRQFCQTVNKPFEGEFLGIPVQGFELQGGQSQFVRVPFATQSTLILPPGDKHELDYVLLSDIFPTAWTCLENSEFKPGDTVAVFGAGPVGLLCAYSAILRGASKVYSIDHVEARLEKAREIGAIPINFEKGDPVTQIMELEPLGVDRACDCVGFEAVDASGKNTVNEVLTNAINVVGTGGGIGVIGVYIPGDPLAPTPQIKKGILELPYATMWLKGISLKGGPVAPHTYHEQIKKLIDTGVAKPSFVFGKEIEIHEALQTYREFANHEILKPVIRFNLERNGHKEI